jgi:hypothetical protein
MGSARASGALFARPGSGSWIEAAGLRRLGSGGWVRAVGSNSWTRRSRLASSRAFEQLDPDSWAEAAGFGPWVRVAGVGSGHEVVGGAVGRDDRGGAAGGCTGAE